MTIGEAFVLLALIGVPVSAGIAVGIIQHRSPEAKAKRARDAKETAYIIEYLHYGFDHTEAWHKARARMRKEAEAAEGLTP